MAIVLHLRSFAILSTETPWSQSDFTFSEIRSYSGGPFCPFRNVAARARGSGLTCPRHSNQKSISFVTVLGLQCNSLAISLFMSP